MTRRELDMLVTVQLDLQRAQWLLKQIVDIAKSEHEREDAHQSAQEQHEGGHDKFRPL